MCLRFHALLFVDAFENLEGGPAFSWDAMLYITKVDLELISNAEIYLYSEKAMRGGAYYIFKEI